MKTSAAKFLAAGAALALALPSLAMAGGDFEARDIGSFQVQNAGAPDEAAMPAVDSGLTFDLQDMGQRLPGANLSPDHLDALLPAATLPAVKPATVRSAEAMTPENSSGMPAWLDRHNLRGEAAVAAKTAAPGAAPEEKAMTPENSSGIAPWLDRHNLRDDVRLMGGEVYGPNAASLNFDGASAPEAEASPAVVDESVNAQKALKINHLISQIAGIRKAYEPKMVETAKLSHTVHYYGLDPARAAFERTQGEIAQISGELKGYLDLLLTPLTASTNGGSVIENGSSITSSQDASSGLSGTFFAHVSRSQSSGQSVTVGGRRIFNVLPPEIERVLAVKGLTLDNVEEYLGILEGRLRQNLEELTQLSGNIYKEYYLTQTETVKDYEETTVTKRPWYFLGLIPVQVKVKKLVERRVKRNKTPLRSYGPTEDASLLKPFSQYAQGPLPAPVIK